MGKYDKYNPRSRARERPWTIHPVWRGIGCIMVILIPIMAYAGSVLLVQMNLEKRWLPAPAQLMQTVSIPYLGSFPGLYANLLVTVLLSLVGFSVLTAIYSIVYRMFGPPQYGPLDAPPDEYRYKNTHRTRR